MVEESFNLAEVAFTKDQEQYIETMYLGMRKAFEDAGVEATDIPDRKVFEKSITDGASLSPPRPRSFKLQMENSMFEGISVEKYWWGPIITIPESAMNNVSKSQSVLAGIFGILAVTPLAPFAGPIAAVLALQWAIFQLVDQGNGIKLRNTWATLQVGPAWIPTPI